MNDRGEVNERYRWLPFFNNRITIEKLFGQLLMVILFFGFLVAPLYYHQRSNSVVRSDLYLFWIISGVAGLYAGLLIRWSLERWGLFILLLALYTAIRSFTSSGIDLQSLESAIAILCSGFLVYALSSHLQASRDLYLPLIASICSAIFQLAIGYEQWLESGFEPLAIKGWFNNSGYYANYLLGLSMILAAGAAYRGLSRLQRLLLAILFIASAGIIMASASRAAIIGILAGGGTMILYSYKPIISSRKIKLALLGIFSMLLVVFVLLQFKPESARGRWTIYKVDWQVFKDNIFWGVGPNKFKANFNNYQAAYFQSGKGSLEEQFLATDTYEAFNWLLQLLIEYGLAGTIFVLILLVIIYRRIGYGNGRKTGCFECAGLGITVSLLISGLFSNPFHCIPIWMIFLLGVSLLLTAEHNKRTVTLKAGVNLKLLLAIVPVAVLLFSIFLIHAERKWQKAKDAAVFSGFDSARNMYLEAYPFLQQSDRFLYNYGSEAVLADDVMTALPILERARYYISNSDLYLLLGDLYALKGHYSLSRDCYLRAIFIRPTRLYAKYKLIQLCIKFEEYSQAKVWIRNALSFPLKEKTDLSMQLRYKIQGLEKQLPK